MGRENRIKVVYVYKDFDVFTGNTPSNVAPLILNAGASYRFANDWTRWPVEIGGSVRHVGRRFLFEDDLTRMEAYTTADLFAFLDIPGREFGRPDLQNLRLGFRVRNVTDTVYAAYSDPGYPDQWNLPLVGWDQIYDPVNPLGSSTIAVLDTGVSTAAGDLNLGTGWSAFGNDPTNWFASGISAGTANVFNSAPQVNITSPTNNSHFTVPAMVNVTIDASDPDGSITQVELLANGARLAVFTNTPYAFSWTNAGPGTYSLTAKAKDNGFATALSPAVIVAINMIVAVSLVHGAPFFTMGKTGGWALELQGFYFFTAVAIMLLGAGKASVGGANGRLN